MKITITLSDEIANSIQYCIDNCLLPIQLCEDGTYKYPTVEELIQYIVDINTPNYIKQAEKHKDNEILRVVKSDSSLSEQVNNLIVKPIKNENI